jgi:hypothetical protein
MQTLKNLGLRRFLPKRVTDLEVQINAEPGRLERRGGEVGRMDKHLARNATNVEARPLEGAHLDQGDSELVEPLVNDRVPDPVPIMQRSKCRTPLSCQRAPCATAR